MGFGSDTSHENFAAGTPLPLYPEETALYAIGFVQRRQSTYVQAGVDGNNPAVGLKGRRP